MPLDGGTEAYAADCQPVCSFFLQTRLWDVVLLWPPRLSSKIRNVDSVDGTNQTKHL
jgi:hypothetical protein